VVLTLEVLTVEPVGWRWYGAVEWIDGERSELLKMLDMGLSL
jgi:hypothetical protein